MINYNIFKAMKAETKLISLQCDCCKHESDILYDTYYGQLCSSCALVLMPKITKDNYSDYI